MRRVWIIFFVLLAAVIALLSKDKKITQTQIDEGKIDETMQGPEGQVLYIGSGGGRYFIKNDKKIFVGYKY